MLGCRPGAVGSPIGGPEQPLRVGTSGDYPPFSDWAPETTEARGFSADVARAYALSQGRPIEWVRFRWPNLARDLAAERFDLALSGVTVRPDRSIAGRFSLPLTTSGAIALVDADSEFEESTDLDRPEVGIAVNAGGHLERVARRLFARARIIAVPENQRVLDQLGRDGVRAVLTDSLEAPIWQAKRAGLRAIGPLTRDRKAAWFPIPQSGGRAAGPRSLEEIRRFDAWLLDAEGSGELARLRAMHGLPNGRTAAPKAALLASLDERLSLMPAVADAKRTLGSPIEDRPREARVLAGAARGIEAAAQRIGLPAPSAGAVEAVYRAQIEAAKDIQRRFITARTPRTARAPLAARQAAETELTERIRPALIFLGDRIAMLLVVASAPVRASDRDRYVEHAGLARLTYLEVERALTDHGLPEARLRALHAALVELARRQDAPESVAAPTPTPTPAAPSSVSP